ncbi:MAG: hypothetical protein Q9M89_08190 [Persephonella sp.]|nr:hypothetical protein [Persephonella sp.]
MDIKDSIEVNAVGKLNKIFEILDYAEFLAETERELFECQPEFEHYKTLNIQAEKPIAIIFSSDIHFGSIHTNISEKKCSQCYFGER